MALLGLIIGVQCTCMLFVHSFIYVICYTISLFLTTVSSVVIYLMLTSCLVYYIDHSGVSERK